MLMFMNQLKPLLISENESRASRLGADWLHPERLQPDFLTGRNLLLDPRNTRDQSFLIDIARWRKLGLIQTGVVGFPFYAGIHWHPSAKRTRGGRQWGRLVDQIDFWAVFSKEDQARYCHDRVFFSHLPTALPDLVVPPAAPGGGIQFFVGGRQNRDHFLAYRAAVDSGVTSLFVSDLLPKEILGETTQVETISAKVPKRNYIELMKRALVVGVPLTRADRARGQTDAALAVALGLPLVVSTGSTCDDYVDHGRSGLLVPNDSREWSKAIQEILENYDFFSRHAERRKDLVSYESFRRTLLQVMTSSARS